jgi:hypothetical protein
MKNIIEPFEDSKREAAPGFSETRRRMLWLPASIAASVMLDRAGKVFAVESSQEESMNPPVSSANRQLDWASFLKQCAPVAEELHKDSSAAGQEAYLHWIANV